MRRISNFRPTSSAGLRLLASLLGLFGASLQARTPSPDSSLDRQIDKTFQQVLKAPADARVGNSYAVSLVKADNYETFVASFNPAARSADNGLQLTSTSLIRTEDTPGNRNYLSPSSIASDRVHIAVSPETFTNPSQYLTTILGKGQTPITS